MEESNQPFNYIINFLLDPHDEDNKIGMEILYKIFTKEFNKFDILKKNTTSEDLFHEFLYRILFKERGFKLNQTIKNKLFDERTNIVSYIYMTIHNFLRTKHREILKNNYINEEGLKEKQIPFNIKDAEGKEKEVILKSESIEMLTIFEAEEILEEIQSEFSEKDKRTLCYMFFEDKTFFEEDLSDDAVYQRKSRLKKKLFEFVREKGFSPEGFAYFVTHILMSEICQKFR